MPAEEVASTSEAGVQSAAENFSGKGKTFEDAMAELGFPSAWASCAPTQDDGQT